MENNLNFFFSILGKFGWLGNWLFLFFALLECIPFIGGVFPGATLIAISGFLAAQGSFKVINIIIFAAIGSFIGDYVGYSLGRYGNDWAKRLINQKLLDKSESFFKKYGYKSIFWGRFFGATRAIIPFTAGLSKMPQRSFLLWNIISSLAWSLFTVFLGYFSGSVLGTIIRKWLHRPVLIVVILVVVGLTYWLIKTRAKNIKSYYQEKYQLFNAKSAANPRIRQLEARYPATTEFLQNESRRRKIFNILIGVIGIAIIYLITMIFNLF